MEKLEQAQPLLSLSPTRCPYCHDEVQPSEYSKARVCEDCLARHHEDCWQESCCSCGSVRALGSATKTAVAPRQRESKPLLEARLAAEYETIKRWANRASIVLFALYFLFMFAGLLAAAGLGTLHQSTPPWTMIPGFVAGGLFALVLIPLVFLNLYDALMRSRVDPSCRLVAFGLVGLTWFTAGISGIVYYLVWGWRPLPRARGKDRAESSGQAG